MGFCVVSLSRLKDQTPPSSVLSDFTHWLWSLDLYFTFTSTLVRHWSLDINTCQPAGSLTSSNRAFVWKCRLTFPPLLSHLHLWALMMCIWAYLWPSLTHWSQWGTWEIHTRSVTIRLPCSDWISSFHLSQASCGTKKKSPNKYEMWRLSPLRLLTLQDFNVSYAGGRLKLLWLCLPLRLSFLLCRLLYNVWRWL